MRPNDKDLLDNLGKIAYTLDKAYLSRLSEDYGVWYFDERYNQKKIVCYEDNIRALKVDRWIFDREEKPEECFKNVLSLFADGDHTLALVVKRTPQNTEMYFVVKNEGSGRNEDSKSNENLLDSSLRGNFPGTHTVVIEKPQTARKLFSFSEAESVAVLSNSPSKFSEDYITQGLDKLLNGIVPKDDSESYSVVFLAESLTQDNIREILSGYEEIATAIHPFLSYQFREGENNTETTGEMQSISHTESISNSVFKTHSLSIGVNGGTNRSASHAHAEQKSQMHDIKGEKQAKGMTAGAILGAVAGGVVGYVTGGVAGAANGAVTWGKKGASIGSAAGGIKGALDEVQQETKSSSETDTFQSGQNIGGSLGYGYGWGKSKTVSNGTTDTKGTSSSVSVGTSQDTSYTYKSYMVSGLIEKLEKTIEHINRSQATGLWKFSTYVLAKDSKTSKNVASYLGAVTQGKESFLEPLVIQEWSKEESEDVTPFGEIIKYVSHFTHPVFATYGDGGENAMMVTPTSYVATDELSHVFVFPRKSVQGLPVMECVSFGREPHSLIKTDENLEIGSAYHMREVIESQRIRISKEELTKHTFITGSTGSGKSNTIYKLLACLNQNDVRFLVVEPTKGEYRSMFGKQGIISVFGTNPKLNDIQMLHINPFKFPKSVHVLEHLDRLVEIFNVCWPMYAAMPAILKDSMERAYIEAGWDLMTSENKYDDNIFPAFADVLKQIKIVLEESDYSADNRGDYTGALVTRVRSLTNGINGLIFSADDIEDEQLFDRNVIVDLSRVGSTETKALIMGLLVLKLQEYRMEKRSGQDEKLQHVTVLEEAHHLLKKTSAEQSAEGANLLGKSVEMLANSIAEMRTYGEGFIIADQAPGLLDMSVIRNTNTKIILRLPDFTDRELVGKAAGLTDDQLIEVGRLEKGVASITQSDWLEPVLCKIDEFDKNTVSWKDNSKGKPHCPDSVAAKAKESLLDCIMSKEIYREGDRVDIQKLKDAVIHSKLDTATKCDFVEYIKAGKEGAVKALRKLVYDFFDAGKAIQASNNISDANEWIEKVLDVLEPSIKEYSREQINLVVALIVREQVFRDSSYGDRCRWFVEIYKEKGGII